MINYAQAVEEYGSQRAAARALGIPESTLRGRLKQDPAILTAMEVAGTRMVPSSVWIKTKTHSIQLRPQQPANDLHEVLPDLFSRVVAVPAIPAPSTSEVGLCSLYAIFDAHIGMYARAAETGHEDYDLKLVAEDMRMALAEVAKLTPNSSEAILLLGGDTLHVDDNRSETPAHKHKLDSSGRFFEILTTAVQVIADTIETLLRKHEKLTVRVLRGNHDEHAHLMLYFALSQRYRDNPRLVVDSPVRDLFMFQWGKTAIFAHHGDKAKPERLALLLSDTCPFWSSAPNRYVFTGHVHHERSLDLGPIRWESLRAFSPMDAYAANMGFCGRRAMSSLTFDQDLGLILRTENPVRRPHAQAHP